MIGHQALFDRTRLQSQRQLRHRIVGTFRHFQDRKASRVCAANIPALTITKKTAIASNMTDLAIASD